MNRTNILIVDDIEMNIILVVALLDVIPNVKLYEAQSAKEALKIISQNSIDFILSDIQMPEMDGFEFAKTLKNNPKTTNIPFIFITASQQEAFKLKGYEFGAIDYINKPIDGNVLIAKVKNYIKIIELQKSLEIQNKYITSLFNASNEAQIIIDKYSMIIDCNKSARKLFPSIITGKTLNQLLENNTDEKNYLKEYINTLSFDLNSTQIFKHDKKYYKISYKFLNLDKHIISFFDVTKEIKESKRKDVIYNSQRSIVCVTNGNNIRNINKIFYDEFGFKNLDDFKSQHQCVCELFITKEGENFLPAIKDGIFWNKYILLHPEKTHSVCMINKDNIEKIYEIKSSGNIFDNENESDEEEVIVFYDVTEIRNQKLIVINQSRQAAMGEMISMIAHQWRQPLTTIVAILSKLKMKYDLDMLTAQDFQKDLDITKSVVQHLSKTIDLFRDYFKEKDGTKILASALFEDVFNIINPIFENNNIKSIFDCNALVYNNIQYLIDNRLDQVLLNIYQNATDALNENKSLEHKSITTSVFTNKNEQIVITICDNGGGIPMEILTKIFTPYFSTKSKNGSGLGLYMSKNIVENQIGGTLEAYNFENGACFKITLVKNN